MKEIMKGVMVNERDYIEDSKEFIYRVCFDLGYRKLCFDFLIPSEAFHFAENATKFWSEDSSTDEMMVKILIVKKEESL